MKSILLTTTAIVAFAGAAYADGHAGVAFSGDFTLGFNDDNDDDDAVVLGDNDGFYWEGDLNVAGTAALDNGLTAGASWEFDIADETNGQNTVSDNVVLSLTTETSGLYLGDTAFAAETQWSGAGDMEADGFSEADGENVLRGDIGFGDIEASVSLAIGNANGDLVSNDTDEDYDQLSFGASGDLGQFGFAVAYQEQASFGAADGGPDYWNQFNGDFSDNEIFGISGSASFGGADLTLAYAQKTGVDGADDESSLGFQVAYPVGPVTATVYYVAEEDNDSDEDNYGVTVAYADGPISATLDYDYDQGVNKVGLDGSYDVGNGLTILAGLYNESDSADEGTDYYVAGEYDLGGGASLLVAYAEADRTGTADDDEVGGPDYQVGTTVEVSFSF